MKESASIRVPSLCSRLRYFPQMFPRGVRYKCLSFIRRLRRARSSQITITLSSGPSSTVNVTGTGIAPNFTYQLLTTTPPTTITPPGPISFTSVNVGQTSSVSTIRVLNSGSANGTINSISLTPQVFQLATPVQVPQTLGPNASVTLTINFTPTQPGAVSGTLIINSDTFTLTGTGLGSQLVYSYLTNGTTITLGSSNPSVIFTSCSSHAVPTAQFQCEEQRNASCDDFKYRRNAQQWPVLDFRRALAPSDPCPQC